MAGERVTYDDIGHHCDASSRPETDGRRIGEAGAMNSFARGLRPA